ncbi:MAG TPA: hypothetical protein VGR47_05885 [Terracidiphilus sp.]|nr:hypothetical protein [Terracidiphilus sp.]
MPDVRPGYANGGSENGELMGAGVRFVVVGTMLRGALETPEPLDDANQWRAFSAWREDASREVRVAFELAHDDARVVWARGRMARSA